METMDYDHNVFTKGRGQQDDVNLLVRFFMDPVLQEDESSKEGRPIYRDTEMIEIRVKGDRNNNVIRPVRPEDKKRFRNAWLDYSDDARVAKTGTPLGQWPACSRSLCEELKFFGFFTVEDVASAGENAFAKMNGLRTLSEKAKVYLLTAKGDAPAEQLVSQNQVLSEQLGNRDAVIAEQAAEIARLKAASGAGPAVTVK